MKPSLGLATLLIGGLAAVVGRAAGGPAVMGIAGGAVGFILAPGLATAIAMAPGGRLWLTVARALFLGPLIAGIWMSVSLIAGVPALQAGLLLVGGSTVGALVALGVARREVWSERTPVWERRLILWSLVLVALILVPHALREWVRFRSDAWFHTAVTLEVMSRGLPPGDPYFAGLNLNYMTFYHALLAGWASVAGVLAWDLGGVLNAMWLVSLAAGAYSLSLQAGRTDREAFFAALFVVLGLGALFWLWIPLKVAKGMLGDTSGPEHVGKLLRPLPFTVDRIAFVTSTFGSPPPLINKYLVMTAFSGSLTATVWLFEALVGLARARITMKSPTDRAWEEHRQRLGVASKWHTDRSWLWLIGAAAFASWVWHPAMGLTAGLALALSGISVLVFPASVGRVVVLRAVGPYVLGSLAGAPWLLAATGRSTGPFPLGLSPAWAAILVAGTGAILFGVFALIRMRGTGAEDLMRRFAVAMAVVSFLIVLPFPNTHDKMPFAFFLLLGVAGGWGLSRMSERLADRGLGWLAVLILGLILVPATGMCVAAVLVDPSRPLPTQEEARLYQWIREETPHSAVIVDTPERFDVLVRGERRQYWGRDRYARLWGYPAEVITRRRGVVTDLYGNTPGSGAVRSAVAELDAFAKSQEVAVYVVLRTADRPPWSTAPEGLDLAWENPAARVYRVLPDGIH